MSTRSGVRMSPTIAVRSGMVAMPSVPLSAGYSERGRPRWTRFRRAASGATPGFKRPMSPSHCDRRATTGLSNTERGRSEIEVHLAHRSEIPAWQHANNRSRDSVDVHVASQDGRVTGEETRPAVSVRITAAGASGASSASSEARVRSAHPHDERPAARDGYAQRVEEPRLDPRHARDLRAVCRRRRPRRWRVHKRRETGEGDRCRSPMSVIVPALNGPARCGATSRRTRARGRAASP